MVEGAPPEPGDLHQWCDASWGPHLCMIGSQKAF